MKTKLTEYRTKIPEDENEKVWKYMDIWKFIDLLSKQTLHFSRADIIKKYEPFDGKYPDSIFEIMEKFYLKVNKGDKKQTDMDIDFEKIFLSGLDKLHFINCWNLSTGESAALWKIYTQNKQGIAIQTTFKKLMDSIEKKGISVGLVEYIDHKTLKFDDGNSLNFSNNQLFLKHKAYSYEQELRLVYYEYNLENIKAETIKTLLLKGKIAYNKNEYIKIPIKNLDNLIENIYASPFIEIWQIEILNILLEKFNIDKIIKNSDLFYNDFTNKGVI